MQPNPVRRGDNCASGCTPPPEKQGGRVRNGFSAGIGCCAKAKKNYVVVMAKYFLFQRIASFCFILRPAEAFLVYTIEFGGLLNFRARRGFNVLKLTIE